MNVKLTLRLDDRRIRRAKAEARRRGKSVSQMVAEYFDALGGQGQPEAAMRSRRDEAEVIFRRVGITFAVYGAKDEEGAGTERLIDYVKAPEATQPLLGRLLGHVLVVKSAADLPADPAAGFAWVALDGTLLHADGCAEFWMRDARAANPLSRKNLVAEARSNPPIRSWSTPASICGGSSKL